jgi:hypothetical protein
MKHINLYFFLTGLLVMPNASAEKPIDVVAALLEQADQGSFDAARQLLTLDDVVENQEDVSKLLTLERKISLLRMLSAGDDPSYGLELYWAYLKYPEQIPKEYNAENLLRESFRKGSLEAGMVILIYSIDNHEKFNFSLIDLEYAKKLASRKDEDRNNDPFERDNIKYSDFKYIYMRKNQSIVKIRSEINESNVGFSEQAKAIFNEVAK